MNKWMKKITVMMVTILTLGLYVPPIYVDADMDDSDKGEVSPSSNDLSRVSEQQVDVELQDPPVNEFNNELYLGALTDQAKYQLMEKLGGKIASGIDLELEEVVLPNLESVLEQLYDQIGEKQSQYLVIAEDPASGYGERIFNLYDVDSKKDIATFHVKRVKRPQEGYFFQFHYHLANDNFEEHYTIADIYWGKNTPPKWMS
ncbi:YpjP family protein [Gracilibacillus xinjiangensis]|uniref:YpjP family protein n=1 Tax=Gracilibacillus xinjiangensis TaxID=1193282 RepID=A0ABV8WQK9_9BACI